MMKKCKDALIKYLTVHGSGDGLYSTPIDGLFMLKTSSPEMPNHLIYRPALCLVVQGAKRVMCGDQILQYGEGQALVVNIETPVYGQVVRARQDAPYLAIVLEFDLRIMREVMEELEAPPRPRVNIGPSLFVTELNAPLLDCMLRLVALLKTPKAIPILYPSLMREICYWMLTGENGEQICKLVIPDSHTQRITEAIHLLRERYASSIRVEELARAARMSPSSFHQHFKSLTSMTPLQYQKNLPSRSPPAPNG
jgi:AraC-type transcriptional regulator N-terminus/Bacterial regulatory helix-turn-helix proteins, AraC family